MTNTRSRDWTAKVINPNCCRYSVRSYFPAGDPDEGVTQWTADYWAGSTGLFSNSTVPSGKNSPNGGDVLRVTIDSLEDVYVAGPRATTAGGEHWNVVKYDGATGQEIYKLDVSLGQTGNVWAILYVPDDDIIYLHGDYTSIVGVSPVLGAINPDGTAASTAGFVTFSTTGGGSAGILYDGSQPLLIPCGVHTALGPDLLPYYQALKSGKLATFGAHGAIGWAGSQCVIESYPVSDPFGIAVHAWSPGYGSVWPNCSPHAIDLIDGGTEQLLAIAAQSIYFGLGNPTSYTVLLDTALDGPPTGGGGGSTPPMTYRWRDDARLANLLRFQDTTYLISTAGGSPKVQWALVSDGSKVIGHNHQNVTAIAVASDAIVTVGGRQSKATDQDFV